MRAVSRIALIPLAMSRAADIDPAMPPIAVQSICMLSMNHNINLSIVIARFGAALPPFTGTKEVGND